MNQKYLFYGKWELPYKEVLALGLEKRIVRKEQKKVFNNRNNVNI